jgi:hypothetical protein
MMAFDLYKHAIKINHLFNFYNIIRDSGFLSKHDQM